MLLLLCIMLDSDPDRRGRTYSLSVYVRKLNVVIFFAIILQNTFKIS